MTYKANIYRNHLTLGLIIVLLSGCTTFSVKQVDKSIAHFQSYALLDLIAAWGVPTRQIDIEGQTILEWQNKEESSSSSISIGSATGGRGWSTGVGLTLPFLNEPDTCLRKAVFTKADDNTTEELVSLSWKGDKNYCGKLLELVLPKPEKSK